ncbi:MAG: helix-turn-helix domain-containing protein, partial [Candidatus Eisenbacteria bacterium]
VPQYFWTKWAPILGPIPSMLYLRLRQYCYHNPQTGETRNECWPKQSTLARDIGVKKRHTVGKALRLLEDYGFIERSKQYRNHSAALKHRTSDVYRIWFELPLTPDDAAELLVRTTSDPSKAPRPNKAPERPHCEGPIEATRRPECTCPVENQPITAPRRPHIAGPEGASRTRTSNLVLTNVSNVGDKRSPAEALSQRGSLPRLSETLRRQKEGLAHEIGDSLKRFSMDRRGGRHRSYAFHRRVAFLMQEHLVREALSATRDAVEESRAGRKGLGDPSAYFAGAVRKIARRESIDLGVKGW